MSDPKIAVAMSGGVDSSLTAALLQEAGYEVVGLYMKLFNDDSRPNHAEDARKVCQLLDIPFHVLHLEEAFKTGVLDYFGREYVRGRTPNPCVVCNQQIKFGLLLDKAVALEAHFLATGHYARVDRMGEQYRLLKGVDSESDQSYFLYTFSQKQLSRIMFPIGTYSKSAVRQLAQERGLPVADKRKSHDLCFVGGKRYQDFLKELIPSTPSGPIVDVDGRQIGTHRGLASYTIGQRTGLGIAAGKRIFVLSLDAESNTMLVGPEEELMASALRVSQVSFVGDRPDKPVMVEAKVRYRSPATRAMLFPNGPDWQIEFDTPQRAIAPGQAVVFFRGVEVLGGGIIEASWTDCRRSMVKTRSGPSDTG